MRQSLNKKDGRTQGITKYIQNWEMVVWTTFVPRIVFHVTRYRERGSWHRSCELCFCFFISISWLLHQQYSEGLIIRGILFLTSINWYLIEQYSGDFTARCNFDIDKLIFTWTRFWGTYSSLYFCLLCRQVDICVVAFRCESSLAKVPKRAFLRSSSWTNIVELRLWNWSS